LLGLSVRIDTASCDMFHTNIHQKPGLLARRDADKSVDVDVGGENFMRMHRSGKSIVHT
jgi:hypothetical protein